GVEVDVATGQSAPKFAKEAAQTVPFKTKSAWVDPQFWLPTWATCWVISWPAPGAKVTVSFVVWQAPPSLALAPSQYPWHCPIPPRAGHPVAVIQRQETFPMERVWV